MFDFSNDNVLALHLVASKEDATIEEPKKDCSNGDSQDNVEEDVYNCLNQVYRENSRNLTAGKVTKSNFINDKSGGTVKKVKKIEYKERSGIGVKEIQPCQSFKMLRT